MTAITCPATQLSLVEGAPGNWLLPSSAEMAQLDQDTIDQGTSALELMERAGAAVGASILEKIPGLRRCCILCGPGNNGGDGLVIGRLLRERGVTADIVLCGSERYSRECATQLAKTTDVRVYRHDMSRLGAGVCSIQEQDLREILGSAELLVDALLGTGQRDAPRGVVRELLEIVSESRAASSGQVVVAVDMPTGINADSGALYHPHLRADHTIAIELVKRGMLQFPARAACGSIRAVSVGIAPGRAVEYGLVTEESVARLTPRVADVHKGVLGRVLVVGGSLAMPGAPMLSALGALRAGAGIVSRVVRRTWHTAPALPEAMYEILEGEADYFCGRDAERLLSIINNFDVAVLGPGIGVRPETGEFVSALLAGLRGTAMPLVLDADALNLVAAHRLDLRDLRVIMTPHPGEAARLLQISPGEIQRDRFLAAQQLARRYGVCAVLKGAGTLVHNGTTGRLVGEGTPFLATPGSGDVLAGIIAACINRTPSLYDAASLGAWVHAKAGVKASERTGGIILASDIASAVSGFCV
jgi:hydroxyethylthiazole kinase-like uncharacterized protein yjeF